jgi:hypothetical protein
MDNSVFEILLAIYLIFTFVGGILKKKKKNEARNAAANRDEIRVDDASASNNQNDAARDFFSQMLGVGTVPRQEEAYHDYEEDEASEDDNFIELQNNDESPTWNPESEFNDTEFDQNSIPPVDNLASQYVPEEKKSEFQKPVVNDYHVSESESSYFIKEYSESTLIEKLRNPSSLRDAILLSEILAKPKALRNNG